MPNIKVIESEAVLEDTLVLCTQEAYEALMLRTFAVALTDPQCSEQSPSIAAAVVHRDEAVLSHLGIKG